MVFDHLTPKQDTLIQYYFVCSILWYFSFQTCVNDYHTLLPFTVEFNKA